MRHLLNKKKKTLTSKERLCKCAPVNVKQVMGVQVCLWVHVHVCVHYVCVCTGQRSTLDVFLSYSPPYVLVPSFSLKLELGNRLEWLTRAPWGPTGPFLPHTGITGVHCHSQLLCGR